MNLAVGWSTQSHASGPTNVDIGKTKGRDNKMYFVSETNNLDSPDKLMIARRASHSQTRPKSPPNKIDF